MNIYICENHIDGIFSGVYQAFDSHTKASDTKLVAGSIDNYELFANYISVDTNYTHSNKVSNTIKRRLGAHTHYDLCMAMLCEAPYAKEVADCVYHSIVLGFAMKDRGPRVLEQRTYPFVHTICKSARTTSFEYHHLLGLTRFHELSGGILFAPITPKHNIITMLMEHFDSRMPQENYIIYDQVRDLAALHYKGHNSILMKNPQFEQEALKNYSSSESNYQDLWKTFFDTIAIESRSNPRLQMQHAPKRFWQDLPEMQK